MNEVIEFLDKHNACQAGRDFASQYNTLAEVWENCPRSDWLLWMLRRANVRVDIVIYRKFATICCREIWDLITDPRSRHAVEASERHWLGLATDEELRMTMIAADDAVDDAYAANDVDAAYAANTAANAAVDAAYVADVAVGDDCTEMRERQANILRYLIDNPFIKE